MKYIIIAIVVIMIFVFIKYITANKNNDTETTSSSPTYSNEFIKYYNAVDRMSYKQLDKMHEDLLPLCTRSLVSGLVWYDDSIPYERKKQEENRIKNNIGDTIPKEEQIYGCQTYEQASKLNQKIVKILDQMDN